MEKILFTTQVLSFFLYTGYITLRFGVIKSISESWYLLPKNQRVLFTLFIWSMAIPMVMYETSLFFFSGASLAFVGAATMFKDDVMTKVIHYLGAVLGITLASIELALNGIMYPIIIGLLSVLIFGGFKINNRIYWIEVICSICLIFGIYQLKL